MKQDEQGRNSAQASQGAGASQAAGAGAPQAAGTSQAAGTPQGAGAPAASDAGDIPEGFTLPLAIVDLIPVVEFCASAIVLASRFESVLFGAGALCCALAGCMKVLWKLILAIGKKDVAGLNSQFRYLMAGGWLFMIIAVIANLGSLHLGAILLRALQFPAVLFFALGIAGMVAMGVMGARLDRRVARNNWIEEITNALAQGMILVGLLLW